MGRNWVSNQKAVFVTQEKGVRIWEQDLCLNPPLPNIHYRKWQCSSSCLTSSDIVFFLESPLNKLGVKCSILKTAISHLSPSSALTQLSHPNARDFMLAFLSSRETIISFKGIRDLCTGFPDLIKGSFVVLWAIGSLDREPGWGGRTQLC